MLSNPVDISQVTLFTLGFAIYALVMWDVLKTTLSLHGSGPLTNLIVGATNKLISAPPAKFGEDTNRSAVVFFFARYSGLLLTSILFVMWFVGLTVSLTLVLASTADSVTQNTDGSGVDLFERLYFVAASVTTAGFGDYVPNGNGWRFFTIVTATSGLIVTTLGISYVINLIGAVVNQRQLARSIVNLGTTPTDILSAFYDTQGFAPFGDSLQSIGDSILLHVQHHLAYPMCHYVRADDNRNCLPAALAVFDETLTVLLYEVPKVYQPNLGHLFLARRAVSAYLENLRDIYIDEADEAPPWPELTFLMTKWRIVPAGRERDLSENERESIRHRRRLLRAAVQSQGLSWDNLVESLRGAPDESLDAAFVPLFEREQAESVH